MPFTFLVYSFPFFNCRLVQFVESVIKPPVGKLLHDTISYVLFIILILVSAVNGTECTECLITQLLVFIWVVGLTFRWIKVSRVY